jgi:hypothetical protein
MSEYGAPPPTRDLCGTMLVHRKLLNESMTYRARRATIENRALQYEQGRRPSTRTDVLKRMNACLEGTRASFLVAQGVRAPVAMVPAGAQSEPDGEVERLLHDSERLTREILNDIRSALGLVTGRSGG